MKHQELVLGLSSEQSDGEGWRQVLTQEGLPVREADGTGEPIAVFSGRLPAWFENWIAGGGIGVVSGAPDAPNLLGPSRSAVIHRFRPPHDEVWAYGPGVARLFHAAEGWGECRLHEDRKVKGNNDPDVFPIIHEKALGEGAVIFTGLPLAKLLTASGDSLRRFSAYTDLDERVSSVDKAAVTDTLVWMLQRAFKLMGVPYVSPVRYPGGSVSVFILRIDVDGLFGDSTAQIDRVAADHAMPVSFFFNGALCDRVPGVIPQAREGVEIGQHGYLHNVFEGVDRNRENLGRGKAWVADRCGVDPVGFVAPRGLWNASLEQALVDHGYSYSSDFSLAFDGLPFLTEGGVLQVPVHPYSPERAFVHAKERGLAPPSSDLIADYYLRIMRHQVNRHRPVHLYGHPEILGANAAEILPPLFAEVRNLDLAPMTLGQFATWWIIRTNTTVRAHFQPEKRELAVSGGDGSVPLHIYSSRGVTVKSDRWGSVKLGAGQRTLLGGS